MLLGDLSLLPLAIGDTGLQMRAHRSHLEGIRNSSSAHPELVGSIHLGIILLIDDLINQEVAIQRCIPQQIARLGPSIRELLQVLEITGLSGMFSSTNP